MTELLPMTSPIKDLGAKLLTTYLLPFELLSVLLLVALIGALILAMREKTKKSGEAQ